MNEPNEFFDFGDVGDFEEPPPRPPNAMELLFGSWSELQKQFIDNLVIATARHLGLEDLLEVYCATDAEMTMLQGVKDPNDLSQPQ